MDYCEELKKLREEYESKKYDLHKRYCRLICDEFNLPYEGTYLHVDSCGRFVITSFKPFTPKKNNNLNLVLSDCSKTSWKNYHMDDNPLMRTKYEYTFYMEK